WASRLVSTGRGGRTRKGARRSRKRSHESPETRKRTIKSGARSKPISNWLDLFLPQVDAVVDALDRLIERTRRAGQPVHFEKSPDVVPGGAIAEGVQRPRESGAGVEDPQLWLEGAPVRLHERPRAGPGDGLV